MRIGQAIDLSGRSERDQRYEDLTILGVLPRSWPQHAYSEIGRDAVLDATKNERLPWEVDPQSLRWSWRRIFDKPKPSGKPN